MQIYVWRHNKKFHSYSMIDEPSVNNNFYLDAIAIVLAESQEEALTLLQQKEQGWCIEDLRKISPQIYALDEATVLFTDLNR
ncbi:hypothetical protein [Succinispira mobilis]|uniref:hypothetical protein n=1 Tax=Succinispira mobilis TaxID=78120 RepID=UPI00037A4685|nr:hypothetical protein [Succinispira mobilis]